MYKYFPVFENFDLNMISRGTTLSLIYSSYIYYLSCESYFWLTKFNEMRFINAPLAVNQSIRKSFYVLKKKTELDFHRKIKILGKIYYSQVKSVT